MTMENTPIWLLMTMAKSFLFRTLAGEEGPGHRWYYRGQIGGGFNCWPDGPRGEPMQINGPMWGRAVVVENERMFHHGQACGPVTDAQAPRASTSHRRFGVDPEAGGAGGSPPATAVNQRISRLSRCASSVHWGAGSTWISRR
jgi:hypothetical protein